MNPNKGHDYIVLVLLIFITIACTKDELPLKDCFTTVSYANDIVPIINSSCITGLGPLTGCHDAWILTYDGVVNSVDLGTFQSTAIETKTMPKMPNSFGIDSLTTSEIETLRCWVIQGYPNN